MRSPRRRKPGVPAWALLALALLAVAGCHRRPNVILVTIDTIRPDHLGFEGYSRARTPNLDRFAADGAYFLHCTSPVPITLPSHASMMTGLTPLHHGARDNGLYRLADQNLTLAEILQRAGYTTAAFVSAEPLKRGYNLNQGFGHYDDDLASDDPYSWSGPTQVLAATGMTERKADATTAAAITWLRQGLKEPFFLWIHYFDPHQGYDPPPPYRDMFFKHPYDGEVAFVDEQFGRLLATVDGLGLRPRTSLVVTGDHGEGLSDHGELTHAMLAYEPTLRVPLAMQLRGITRPGQKLDQEVGLVDILPTILDHLRLVVPPNLDGASLIPLLRGEAQAPRRFSFETEAAFNVFGWAKIAGIRHDGWKFIHCTRDELYHVAEDPQETTDLIAQRPEVAARLRGMLEEERRPATGSEEIRRVSTLNMSDETRERLAALGYLSPGRATAGSAGGAAYESVGFEPSRLHPLNNIRIINEWSKLRDDVAHERWIEAESRVRSLLAFDPTNPDFLNIEGLAFWQTGRKAEATAVYQGLLKSGQAQLRDLRNLAGLYEDQGERAKALELFNLCLERMDREHPWRTFILARLAVLRKELGDTAGTLQALDEIIAIHPDDGEARRRQAVIYYHAGDTTRAEASLKAAVAANPFDARTFQNLASLDLDLGRTAEALANARHCVRLSPSYPEGRYILALALRENRQSVEARQVLEKLSSDLGARPLGEQARRLLQDMQAGKEE